jgi:hypothetical protein
MTWFDVVFSYLTLFVFASGASEFFFRSQSATLGTAERKFSLAAAIVFLALVALDCVRIGKEF